MNAAGVAVNQLYYLWLLARRVTDASFGERENRLASGDPDTMGVFSGFLIMSCGVLALIGLGIFAILSAAGLRTVGAYLMTLLGFFPLVGLVILRIAVRNRLQHSHGHGSRSFFHGGDTADRFLPLSIATWIVTLPVTAVVVAVTSR